MKQLPMPRKMFTIPRVKQKGSHVYIPIDVYQVKVAILVKTVV